ncbi:MAG: tetratricopeptide repeat protein [Candidatus Omnitrophica bacterium]|nr:tetratricopeptide repeat protein [Candidatus Omnitrophota bacterium]MBI3082908.1 tetratricopeptide repeat protein [Candidatus Omnitrophota bacterium]
MRTDHGAQLLTETSATAALKARYVSGPGVDEPRWRTYPDGDIWKPFLAAGILVLSILAGCSSSSGFRVERPAYTAADPQEVFEKLEAKILAAANRGNFSEVERLLNLHLKSAEGIYGPSDPYVVGILRGLGRLYERVRNYEQAERLFMEALARRQSQVGPTHPKLVPVLLGLAGLYVHQGRYAEAEPLYERVLHIRETAYGPSDPDVMEMLRTLGEVYRVLGRYGEAEALFQRALSTDEAILGTGHFVVRNDLHALGTLYELQDRSADAAEMYARAQAIPGDAFEGYDLKPEGVPQNATGWKWVRFVSRPPGTRIYINEAYACTTPCTGYLWYRRQTNVRIEAIRDRGTNGATIIRSLQTKTVNMPPIPAIVEFDFLSDDAGSHGR